MRALFYDIDNLFEWKIEAVRNYFSTEAFHYNFSYEIYLINRGNREERKKNVWKWKSKKE